MEFPPATPGPPVAPRPIGVTVAAALLALSGCFLLMMACIMFAVAVAVRFRAVPHASASLVLMQIATGVLLLLLAGFCGAVVSGLIKQRNWARLSIIVIGAFQAVLCLAAAALYYAISTSNFSSPAGGPPVDPGLLKEVMYFLSAGFLLGAAAGAWWVVYFNRPRARLWFCPEEDAEDPEAFYPTAQPKPHANRTVEALLIVLAVLLMFSAIKAIVYAGLHFPLFFAGTVFRGHGAVLAWLMLAVLNAGVAIGLLRRDKTAWYLGFILQAYALAAWISMLLPATRARMFAYQHEVQHAFTGQTAVPQTNALLEKPLMFLFSILGLVFILAILWLLVRARPLFFPAKET